MSSNASSNARPLRDDGSGGDVLPDPLSLEDLFHKYGIERSHADNVARNALELFEILAPE